MSTELEMLVWSAALAMAQMLIAVLGATQEVGLATLAGNREIMPSVSGWAGRARRAHLNMLESLAIFAILVLVVHVTGKANEVTAFGATLFFWGRLVYAIVYLAGLPWLRTLVWLASVAGLLILFSELI
ncbi:MAG: MAPEG family protein [Sphingosinicella sp.]